MKITRAAVAALLAALLAGAWLLAGCASADPARTPPAAPTAQPTTRLLAEATARTEFGLLAGGDYAGAWELWSPQAQQVISRADFVRLSTACPSGLGILVTIEDVTTTGPGESTVTWARGPQRGTSQLRYLDGRWRYQPDAATLAEYRLGADRVIKARRAAHTC